MLEEVQKFFLFSLYFSLRFQLLYTKTFNLSFLWISFRQVSETSQNKKDVCSFKVSLNRLFIWGIVLLFRLLFWTNYVSNLKDSVYVKK